MSSKQLNVFGTEDAGACNKQRNLGVLRPDAFGKYNLAYEKLFHAVEHLN